MSFGFGSFGQIGNLAVFDSESLQTLNIDNASLLSYSKNIEYFGSDIGFKKLLEISIQCNSSDISNNSGVSSESLDLFDKFEGRRDYAELVINGQSYGNAKLTSFSTEAGDMVNTLSCSMTFLIQESFEDLSGLTGYYTDYGDSGIDGSLIENFSDSVSLEKGENTRSYSRSIEIQANNSQNIDKISDLVKSYVKNILNYGDFASTFPDLTAFEPEINDLTNSSFKKFVTETIDEIGLSFRFEERLSSADVEGDYSLSCTQTYTKDRNGIESVTESGEIQGLTSPRIDAAEAGYITEKANARTRMGDIYSNYSPECLDLNEKDGQILFVTQSKTINNFEGSIQYSFTANNDPKYKDGNGETLEYTITIDFDGKHTTSSESGTVMGAGNRVYDGEASGSGNLRFYPKYLSAKTFYINTVLPEIETRVKNTISPTACPKSISRSETHSPRKGQISYNHTYSNNPIYSLNDGISKKIESSTSVNYDVPNKAKYVSLDPKNAREIIQILSTKSPLKVNNDINIVGYRINFTEELEKMEDFGSLAANEIKFLGNESDIVYLESANYTFKGASDVLFSLSTVHSGGEDACE